MLVDVGLRFDAPWHASALATRHQDGGPVLCVQIVGQQPRKVGVGSEARPRWRYAVAIAMQRQVEFLLPSLEDDGGTGQEPTHTGEELADRLIDRIVHGFEKHVVFQQPSPVLELLHLAVEGLPVVDFMTAAVPNEENV